MLWPYIHAIMPHMTFNKFWEKVAGIHECQSYVSQGTSLVEWRTPCSASCCVLQELQKCKGQGFDWAASVTGNMFQLALCQEGVFPNSGMQWGAGEVLGQITKPTVSDAEKSHVLFQSGFPIWALLCWFLFFYFFLKCLPLLHSKKPNSTLICEVCCWILPLFPPAPM